MLRSQFMVRVWIWKICVRLSRSGSPNSTYVAMAVGAYCWFQTLITTKQNLCSWQGAEGRGHTQQGRDSLRPRPQQVKTTQLAGRRWTRLHTWGLWRLCADGARRPAVVFTAERTLRSSRPGRSSAGSSVSGLLVAINTCTCVPR